MSTTLYQELDSWRAIEAKLRCIDPKHGGKRLNKVDAETFRSAILLQSLMLSDLLADGFPNRISRIVRWCNTIVQVDVSILATAIKEWTRFFRNFPRGFQATYSGFKHQYRNEFPFTGEFFSPIKEEVELFLTDPQSSTFTIINQHISFLSRLSLKGIDHSVDCLIEYQKCEETLAEMQHDYSLYNDLNKIIMEWFSSFHFEEFHPKHGKGAVAFLGRCSKSVKYRNMGFDPMLQYFLARLEEPEMGLLPMASSLERVCEVVFVPKSVSTWRTISMEPPTLQYFQQGVWSSLDRYMCRHTLLSKHIHIHDQSFNRELAQLGSAEGGSYATIDLSNASDTVSWEMVKVVFSHTPLLRSFYATRSRFVHLPNGKRIAMKKYAPMGSALCFPVECIIFAAVCELAVRSSGTHGRDIPYLVYGDDLVVKQEIARHVCDLLQRAGFTVNSSKTFIANNLPFRESCGGEYFDGVDVTPIRLSRRFSAQRCDEYHPDVFQAHIDMSNLAYRYNLKLVRLWFIHRLLQLPRRLRPLFSEDSSSLHSSCPTNFHLESIYSQDWQCQMVWCGGVTTSFHEPIDDDFEESIRLFEWYRLSKFRKSSSIWKEDLLTSNISQSTPKLKSRRALP